MAAACTSCALPSIGRISIITWHAVLALLSCGQIFALLAHITIDARAVSITLASWTLDEGPLVVLLFRTETGVKSHLAAVQAHEPHGPPRGPFDAVPSPRVAGVVAPATPRLLQALAAGPQARTVLRGAGGRLPLQALSVGEGDDVGVGVHAAPRAAAPHALHAAAGAVGAGGPQGAGLLARPGALVGAHHGFLADEAIGHGRARVRFQARHRGPFEVRTEARVVGLPGKPLQRGVREGRHVLPAPVGYVDLAQANPRCHFLLRIFLYFIQDKFHFLRGG